MNTTGETKGVKPGRHGASGPREELLTTEEVAALLKVTVRTVERWQQDGVLPYLRMGHAIRFYWPAVLDHLIANFTVCRLGKATPHPAGESAKRLGQ